MIEAAIIGWLYFWGGIVIFFMCIEANANLSGATFVALTWPAFVPFVAARRTARKIVAHMRSLEMH